MIDADTLFAQELIARKRLPREVVDAARAERGAHPSLAAALVARGLLPRADAERLLRDLKAEWPSVIDIDRLLPPQAPPGAEDDEFFGDEGPIDPSLIPKPPGA